MLCHQNQTRVIARSNHVSPIRRLESESLPVAELPTFAGSPRVRGTHLLVSALVWTPEKQKPDVENS